MAEWVRALAWTGNRTVPAGYEFHCGKLRFGTLAILFTQGETLSEETLKSVGPFYLVSMPEETKDPTSLHWECVTVVDSTTHSKPPPPVRPLWHWRTDCPANYNTRQDCSEADNSFGRRQKRKGEWLNACESLFNPGHLSSVTPQFDNLSDRESGSSVTLDHMTHS